MADEEPEDLREWIRWMLARSDQMLRDVMRASDERYRKLWADSDARLARLEEHDRQQRAEHEAMLGALWAVLDRLPPPRDEPKPGTA